MFGVMIAFDKKKLHSTAPPLHDLKVKVMDFILKVFRTSLLPNPVMYLVYTLYDAK